MTTRPTIASSQRPSVLLPLGDVEHGNVNRLAVGIAGGLSALGVDTALVDYRAGPEAALAVLRQHLGGGTVRTMMAVNAVGFPTDGHEEIAAHGARLMVFGTDHPCHLHRLTMLAPAGTWLSFPSASNMDYAARYLRPDLNYLHVAHAAPVREPRPWSARDIPVLLVGNLRQGADESREIWTTRGSETPVLEAMHAHYHATSEPTLEGIGEAALTQTGAAGSALAQPAAFAKILRYFDPVVRAELRETILRAIAPLEATIAGDWRGLVHDPGGRCRFIGPQDADAVDDLVGRAKIVINAVPGYYRSHERVFDAMAAGAVTINVGVTDFPDLSAETGVIRVPDITQIRPVIDALLADDKALRHAGEAARDLHRAHHTWTHRAATIKDILSLD